MAANIHHFCILNFTSHLNSRCLSTSSYIGVSIRSTTALPKAPSFNLSPSPNIPRIVRPPTPGLKEEIFAPPSLECLRSSQSLSSLPSVSAVTSSPKLQFWWLCSRSSSSDVCCRPFLTDVCPVFSLPSTHPFSVRVILLTYNCVSLQTQIHLLLPHFLQNGDQYPV